MEALEIPKKIDNKIFDVLEKEMTDNFPLAVCPLTHRFTDGLYVREIFMPTGTLLTSKIHKTQHQFFVLSGTVSVWIDEGTEILVQAPYIGITEPNTRRIIYVWDDCIWATVHPNPNNESIEEIEERIIEKHDNDLLEESTKNKINGINKTLSEDYFVNKINELL